MKSYITAILVASAIAHGAFSEVVTVDLNTKPEKEITYYEGYYYFDLTNVLPDQEYYNFPNVNRSESGTIVTEPYDANALFEIGSNSHINIGMWEIFYVHSKTTNSYVSNDEFTGIVWKFDVGSDGSTGSFGLFGQPGNNNCEFQGMKLFDFSDFDTSKSVEYSQELFNMSLYPSFNVNSNWIALIDGVQHELTYNGTVTIDTEDGTYVITLTEHESRPEERKWLDYEFSFTSNVPEPATYAAVFGALALGFAVYRRRK